MHHRISHVWPYCTFIRHFSEKSFHFPVSVNAPVYISTSVFFKRKFAKKPKVTVYLDGPFYPNTEISKKQAAAELAEKAYSVMCERAKNNSYSYIQYIKKENEE